MSGVMTLGPLGEKANIWGAGLVFSTVVVLEILAVGYL